MIFFSFFTAEDTEGNLIQTGFEHAEAEKQRAEAAEQKLASERRRSEAVEQELASEKQRSEHLAAKLRALGIDPEDVGI